jgi:hypothetical protein
MAKALETALPGFTPSSLQLAAIERIREFQDELAAQGIYMRSAMELEFVVEDRWGKLVPYVINLKEAEKYLTSPKRKLPHLEQVKTDVTAEYEITVADKPDANGLFNPLQFAPLQVAGEMAMLKKGTLRDMLQQTTCLTPDIRGGIAPFRPVFHAYPYSLADKESSWQYENKSSALHVNVSLYDAKGNNLFGKHPALLEHCARSLINVQNEAGLAFLPKKNSLKRVRPEAHGSVPGGLGMEAVLDDGKKRTFSSVNIRGGATEKTGKGSKEKMTHDIRIENRLPGADNDPFVALAVTMAAMVDAVRHDIKTKPKGKAPTHYFADTHEDLVDTMKASTRMRELLGPNLHSAILNEYDKSRSASR